MATTMVNVRMDAELKKDMETVCEEMGMSVSTAFIVFAKTLVRDRKIPFEIKADPFFSEPNLSHLRRGLEQLNARNGVEHDIIEVEDDE